MLRAELMDMPSSILQVFQKHLNVFLNLVRDDLKRMKQRLNWVRTKVHLILSPSLWSAAARLEHLNESDIVLKIQQQCVCINSSICHKQKLRKE